ncbi:MULTISPECIES: hypothetical protein [Streptomyces]|nr:MULTISPECIES: hypothetical protein [Streptomyces]MCZ4096801.1 hypothetical protein [Streptomyces sp. H39-C1]
MSLLADVAPDPPSSGGHVVLTVVGVVLLVGVLVLVMVALSRRK